MRKTRDMLDALLRYALNSLDTARTAIAPQAIRGCVVSRTLEESEEQTDPESDLVPVGVSDGCAVLRLGDLVDLGFRISRSFEMSQLAHDLDQLTDAQKDFVAERDLHGRSILDQRITMPTVDLERLMEEIRQIEKQPFDDATQIADAEQPVLVWIPADTTIN